MMNKSDVLNVVKSVELVKILLIFAFPATIFNLEN